MTDEEHDNGIQYYSQRAGDCTHGQRDKIDTLLDLGLVRYNSGEKRFQVYPIPGYNKKTHPYNLTRLPGAKGGFQCDCQFYTSNARQGKHVVCSHAAAVLEMLARHNKLKTPIPRVETNGEQLDFKNYED